MCGAGGLEVRRRGFSKEFGWMDLERNAGGSEVRKPSEGVAEDLIRVFELRNLATESGVEMGGCSRVLERVDFEGSPAWVRGLLCCSKNSRKGGDVRAA